MDSHQSAIERSFKDILLQNEDDDMSGTDKGSWNDGKAKLFKQELDPLRIGNILEKIFSYLDVRSIKNARQVNQVWSVEGAKILMAKCYVQTPKDVQIKDLGSNKMNQFNAFLSLKSSDRPMIPSITLNNLEDFYVWRLMGVLGPQVEAVKLNIIDDEAFLLHELLGILPNLKYLNLKDSLYSDNIIPVLTSAMSKKKMKETTLVISSMTIKAHNLAALGKVRDFSNCTNIMMEELKFNINPAAISEAPEIDGQFVQIIGKLLSTSQNTLKRLTMKHCIFFLSRLEFPCMPALTHIDLDFNLKEVIQIARCGFRASFQFSETVPNLQEFSVSAKLPDGINLIVGFFNFLLQYQLRQAPSVKRVKCLTDATGSDIENIFKMFPNIEELHKGVNWCSETWFYSLWTLGTKLRKLHLYFDFGRPNSNYDFDGIFTGFTKQTVRKIKDDPNLEPFTLEEVEELRVFPSILNLEELEHLKIDVTAYRPVGDVFSASIAEKYAFRLMPKKPSTLIHVKERFYY